MISPKAAACVAIVALLAACSTTSDNIVNLDNKTKGYRISCDGPLSSKSECYERAAKICMNKGYSVVNEGPLTGQDWMSDKYTATIKCNQ
jgi:hypothetical protein